MTAQPEATRQQLILGLGVTGWSVAHYLKRAGQSFAVVDSRSKPPGLAAFQASFPQTQVFLGGFDAKQLSCAQRLIVSPGICLAEPALQAARDAGVEIVSDVELFCREVSAPVLAITGSNAKSTVTSLVGEMAQAAGLQVAVGGNIGVPVLDLLDSLEPPEVYVLELSSFQLESLMSLKATGAALLNISEDHLDRYTDMLAYIQAKKRIFDQAQLLIYNRDDPQTCPDGKPSVACLSFGLGQPPGPQDFGLVKYQGRNWLVQGEQRLLAVDEVPLKGQHGVLNVMAAYALISALVVPLDRVKKAVTSFRGLPHRCQLVASKKGVDYINDSKATNLGAALAAIYGLESDYTRIWLIMGGEAKGQDFTPLQQAFGDRVAGVALIGRDAELIAAQLPAGLPCWSLETLDSAVDHLSNLACPGDAVLLAPACASFDQFSSYAQRGEVFTQCVQSISA